MSERVQYNYEDDDGTIYRSVYELPTGTYRADLKEYEAEDLSIHMWVETLDGRIVKRGW